MTRSCFAALLFIIPTRVFAGAWTLPEGTTQIITTVTNSDASKSYDENGNASEAVTFHKIFLSAYAEYGLNDWATLIAIPEYAVASSAAPDRPMQKANDFALSGGARVRLFNGDDGVFSLQATARSAGAFELDTSVDQDPGEDFELRALYGRHFELFGHAGCFDVQVAQRWATGKRADETPIDLTLLYDVGWNTQVLLQNFNVITEGSGQPPFAYYRYHKLSLSAVHPLWGAFSVQFGAFISPAGQNALREEGLFTVIWADFRLFLLVNENELRVECAGFESGRMEWSGFFSRSAPPRF